MLNFKNHAIAGTAAVLATLATVVGAAGPVRAETMAVPVSYADLSLSTPDGQKTLERRISHAATKACGPVQFDQHLELAACRRAAIDAAHATLRVKLNASQQFAAK